MSRQLFNKYDQDIIRAEYTNVQPISILNLNNVNKKTTFQVDIGDNFCSSGLQYYITGEYKHFDDTKNYGPKSNVKLVDNFVGYLWSHIEVKKHNKMIDEVENPGIVGAIKGAVSFPGTAVTNGATMNSGFISRYSGGGNFAAVGKLGDLGLGFFSNLNVPIYKGGLEISFTRNTDNDVLYRWKTQKADGTFEDSTLPHIGKVVIKEFILRVPVLEYEENPKIELINELTKINLKYMFNNWQCIQHRNVSGKTLSLDITNIYRNVDNPVFAFVTFQVNRTNDQLKDNSSFDHVNVKNLHFEINGKRYPEEYLDLDFDEGKFCIAYDMYQNNYKNVFGKGDYIPFYTPTQFKDGNPIYCIDLSRQPVNLSGFKNKIKLHVEFTKNVTSATNTTEGTVCNIVVVSNICFVHDILKNIIREDLN